VKLYFDVAGRYEGLRVRHLARVGRIVLDKIIGDPPHAYFLESVLAFA
jgi:hypothetical protein